MKPLECPQARMFLSDLVADAVDAHGLERLGEHLAACSACRQLAVELFRQDLLVVRAASATRVEALAERIRSRLTETARPSRPRRLAWYVGALAASILALLGVFLFQPWKTEPSLVVRLDDDDAGEIFLVNGQDRSRLLPGQAIPAGQAAQTVGDDSRAVLRYPDSTQLVMGPNTTIVFASQQGPMQNPTARGKKVFLQAGLLTADVPQQPKDQPLVLTTPHAEMVVVGTRFWVGTTSDATRIEVEEGRVRFRNKGSKESIEIRSGGQAVAAAPADVNHVSPWEEPFESTEHLKAMRGYRSRNAKVELADDHKEGKSSVRASWTSATAGYGTGGVERSFAAADFTGKTFSIWLKPLTQDTCPTLVVALYDSRGQRVEVRFLHTTRGDWVQRAIPVGQKGNWSDFQKSPDADYTRITRMEIYGITRGGNQKAALLVDGFEEVKGR